MNKINIVFGNKITNTFKMIFGSAFILLIVINISSCKKYLDEKSSSDLGTISSVSDLQALLDYAPYMNSLYSEGSEIAADNYYLTDAAYNVIPKPASSHAAYLWQPQMWDRITDWQGLYSIVYDANVVLENIEKLPRDASNSVAWDNCKGSALSFRAKAFFEIAQIWSLAYDSTTANADLGIPLRLTSDFNVKSQRANLKDTYAQIISDLTSAISLLPDNPLFVYRPSKPGTYGLLARTYLAMREYDKAKLYSDLSLQLKNTLVDYNTLDASAQYPFASIEFTNPEDIFHTNCSITNYNLIYVWSRVDSSLYNMYAQNDLRKSIFFKANPDGSIYFRGSYEGAPGNYNGIATDEMYLIRSECYAREGNVTASMNDLNTLLITRWKAGTFVYYSAPDANTALQIILDERRKELLRRMVRFTDIKRLNKEGANISIKRVIQGQTYLLPPNDKKFALPIPSDVLQLSEIQQNPGY